MVGKLHISGANIDIPAVLIGEEGRGRERGVLPVQLLPAQQAEWAEKGSPRILFAETGLSKSGKPKLIARDHADDAGKIITVFLTTMGFRGGNSHTGDRAGYKPDMGFATPEWATKAFRDEGLVDKVMSFEEVKDFRQRHDPNGRDGSAHIIEVRYAHFPGQTLITGTAQNCSPSPGTSARVWKPSSRALQE